MTNENNNKDKVEVIEGEEHLLLDHDYDGIHELDHPLPSWWTATFWATVIFGFAYCGYYWLGPGLSIDEAFEREYAQVQEAKAEAMKKQGGFDMNAYNAAKVKMDSVGKTAYNMNCSACHGTAGQGGIGPNLTDKYWLHGKATSEDIFKIVKDGVLAKGMPAWGAILNKEQMMAVTAYIESMKGTNPDGAKGPQGEAVE